ncbi:MAG: choice-of-anchor D domain-containing protein [Sedimentisphaerales bacterium]|nr:choice-of-anchor D domain-containing protein [Sedimentisphaerales bacterium]
MARRARRRIFRIFRRSEKAAPSMQAELKLETLEQRLLLNGAVAADEDPDEEVPVFPVVELWEESPDLEGANDGFLIFNVPEPTLLDDTAEQIFRIDNVGTGSLENLTFTYYTWDNDLEDWVAAEPAENPFSLAPEIETLLPLAPEDNPIEIIVTFTPEQTGDYLYRLDISYLQIEEEFVESLILQATAVDPELTITDNQLPDNDQLVDFGQYEVGGAHEYQISLSNSGTTPLALEGWTLEGDTAGVFTITDFASVDPVLVPNEELIITVAFSPTTAGGYNAELFIDTNIPKASLFSVALAGTVLISDSQDDPFDLAINFTAGAPLVAGQVSSPESISLYNNTGEDMLLENISVNNRYFVVNTSQIPNKLLPGSTVHIPVTFNPGNLMDNSNNPAYLTITTNNDAGDNELAFQSALTGRALAAPIVTSSSLYQWARGENGLPVIITLIGPGEAQLVPLASGLVGIDKIMLNGTTTQTIMLVSAAGDVVFGGIEGGSLGMLLTRNITLDNEGINLMALGKMISGPNLMDGADITIAQTSSSGIMMQLGQVGNGSDVNVNGNIKLFTSQYFGDGTFQANNVDTFLPQNSFGGDVNLSGNLKTALLGGTAISGNFIINGGLNLLFATSATFTGAINADSIGMVRFGNIIGADISAAGRIQSVTSALDLVDSRILAGFDLGADGRLGGVESEADQLFSGGMIDRIHVQRNIIGSFISAGIAPTGSNFFEASATAEIGSIGSVWLGGYIDENSLWLGSHWENGVPYGIAAVTGINSVVLGGQKVQPGEAFGDFEVHLFQVYTD